jgi:hypothetical protein
MWRTRSIFVSSSFADMQAERDHLRNFVFPELEERLAGRRWQCADFHPPRGSWIVSDRCRIVARLSVVKPNQRSAGVFPPSNVRCRATSMDNPYGVGPP